MRPPSFCSRKSLKGLALAAALTALTAPVSADFIAVGHPNISSGQGSLFVFGAAGVTGTVTNNAGFNQTFTIGVDGVTEVSVSQTQFLNASNTVLNNAFLVQSADPISGHFLNRASLTTDMTYLHDIESLGTDFRVLGFSGRFGEGSQMSVTAVEDNTTVTITPVVTLSGGQAAGVPFNVTLDAGESMKWNRVGPTGNDLTGSKIVSDKPVAVFSGAACTQVPDGVAACDHIVSQLPSVDNYSSHFIVPETARTGTAGNLLRILAATDGTEVFVDGVLVATLNDGEFYQLTNAFDHEISTSAPVLVGQYLKGQNATGFGDPAFSFLTGTDQLLDEYVFTSPVGTGEFAENYLNIAILDGFLNTLTLNGVVVNPALFSALGGTGWSVGNFLIQRGAGVIKADVPFFASISGFSSFDSYHTIIGATFSPGASPPPPPPPPPPNGVPEPGTLLLMGVALIGLVAIRRRSPVSGRVAS